MPLARDVYQSYLYKSGILLTVIIRYDRYNPVDADHLHRYSQDNTPYILFKNFIERNKFNDLTDKTNTIHSYFYSFSSNLRPTYSVMA